MLMMLNDAATDDDDDQQQQKQQKKTSFFLSKKLQREQVSLSRYATLFTLTKLYRIFILLQFQISTS